MHKSVRGFVQIPNDIVRGGHGAVHIAVLCVVISHGKCTASASTLAREVGCNEKTVRKALKYWEKYAADTGVIIWEQERRLGYSFLIRVTFPGIVAPVSTSIQPEGIGRVVRSVRSLRPTKKKTEKEQIRNVILQVSDDIRINDPVPVPTPEEARENIIRSLRASVEKNPAILRASWAMNVLKRYSLTPTDLWPDKTLNP